MWRYQFDDISTCKYKMCQNECRNLKHLKLWSESRYVKIYLQYNHEIGHCYKHKLRAHTNCV